MPLLSMAVVLRPTACPLRGSFSRSLCQALAEGRPSVVAKPAEAFEALAELFRDGRRKPGVHVFQAALPGVAFCGCVQSEQPLPAFPQRAGARIKQQIRFRGEAQQCRAKDFAARLVVSE